MSAPYRELSQPVRDLAVAAALPPDAYHPKGRWSLAARNAGLYLGTLGGIVAVSMVTGLRLLGMGTVLVWYALLIAHVVYRRRVAFRIARASDEAVALLNGGDVDGAARTLDQLAAQARSLGFYHAVVVFNRGVAFVRQGEPEKALELFGCVARSGWFERFRALGFDALLAAAAATAHALVGDLPAAERELAKARERTGPASRGKLLGAESLVGLRQGDDRAVAARIDAEWSAAEGALPATQLRALRAMQAWALVRSGADEGAVHRAIERARPVRRGEHDHLGARWPELAQFLRERLDVAA